MLAAERRNRILKLLTRKGSVTVTELSKLFGVVPITIRRDLEILEQEGKLVRTHGGAVVSSEPFLLKPLTDKEILNHEIKARIGQVAATLVSDGETLFLDGGSTCIEVARALRADQNKRVTVVTNGLKVAMELSPCLHVTTILVGGVCAHHNYEAMGFETIEAFKRLRAHKYFMGIDAIIPGYGISDGDPHQVPLKLARIASAQEVIGVCDKSKLGRIAVAQVGPISLLSRLVMDGPVPESFKQHLAKEQVTLIEVDCESGQDRLSADDMKGGE